MTEEQYNEAKDIRVDINRLNRLYEFANNGMSAISNASAGDLLNQLFKRGKFQTHFSEFIADEIKHLNDKFGNLGCDVVNNDGWISVEDALPEYEEDVLVCGTSEEDDFGFWACHRTQNEVVSVDAVSVDDNDFAMLWKNYPQITHWRRINPPKK